MKITAEEFWKMATGQTGDGAVVKDKEHGESRSEMASNEGMMGDAKNQDETNKAVRKHVEPKGGQGHNTLRKDDAGLKSNDGKKEESKEDGHLQDNESMGGASPKPKTATEAYLGSVYGMIKQSVAGADHQYRMGDGAPQAQALQPKVAPKVPPVPMPEKAATAAYLGKVAEGLGMGGANAIAAPQPLNLKQPAKLPNPGAQPPVQKN